MTPLREAIERVRAWTNAAISQGPVDVDDLRLILAAAEESEKLRAALRAADAMSKAFHENIAHWPPMGYTVIDYDAARALTGTGEKR